MTQLVLASTLYGAATAAAAIDAGDLGRPPSRVLVMANTTAVPELAPTVADMPGFAALAGYFDRVVSYNDAIAPYHPSIWSPTTSDATLLERHLRNRWQLGDEPVQLVLESIQVPPALALAAVFAASRITVYADGLMTFGPTRTRIGQPVASRIREVLYPDLVPGLRPLVLREFETPARTIDAVRLRSMLDAVTASVDTSGLPAPTDGRHVLVLGQYLSALGVLTLRAEEALHERMVTAAVAAGARSVWFKAHPSAPVAMNESLASWAASQGVALTVLPSAIPAEAVFATAPPRFVVGCFSTALMTAVRLYGIPAATVGTDELLAALRPFENSNRVPVTIAAALLPDLERTPVPPALPDLDPARVGRELQPLVDTVGYCMQPIINADLHGQSAAWIAAADPADVQRYFDRRRLTALGLPGGSYIPLWRALPNPERLRIRRAVGQSRKVARQVRHSLVKVVRP